MRGRPCSICGSDKLTEIDAALAAGNTILHVAATFNIPKSCVHRHKLNCLAPKIRAAAKAMRTTNEVRAPVQKAEQIMAGETPSVEDILSLHGLLERVARSLSRLEGAADFAASENMCASLASVTGQIFKGVETAARMQSIGYKDAAQGQQGAPKFSITISLPQIDTAPTRRAMVDCARAELENSVPQVTSRIESFAFSTSLLEHDDFDLDRE